MAKKIRYAVVGMGHFAQNAVLPAFKNARKNSELVAIFSEDPTKLKKLSRKYGVEHCLSYEQYDDFLGSGVIDAVYLVLPNAMHREYTIRAARQGVHVLCEKPMAASEAECREMIRACEDSRVKLMIAYRLHFERANLEAVELVRKGKLGRIKMFQSLFSYQVKETNDTRLRGELAGGPLRDIGTYCINATRYLFRDEPEEVFGYAVRPGEDERFREVEEGFGVLMRYPGGRLAQFCVSFDSVDRSMYEIVGEKGSLRLDPAYEYAGKLHRVLTIGERSRERTYPKRDQIAPELLYFSDCVLKNREPEPSGWEGLADVRIIDAIFESERTGRPVKIEKVEKPKRPTMEQEIERPAHNQPDTVHVDSPH